MRGGGNDLTVGGAVDCQVGDGADGLAAILQRETCLTELHLAGTFDAKRFLPRVLLHFLPPPLVLGNDLGPNEFSMLASGLCCLASLELLDLTRTPSSAPLEGKENLAVVFMPELCRLLLCREPTGRAGCDCSGARRRSAGIPEDAPAGR